MKATAILRVKFVPGLTAFLLLAALATGCGSDSPSGSKSPEQIIAEGWNHFESGDFSSAVASFSQAYSEATKDLVLADALEGRAWSYARLGELESARDDFVLALSSTAEPTQDRYAGISMVYLALRDYEEASDWSYGALTYFDLPYEFEHDSNVTDVTIRLVRAISRFHEKQYEAAYDDVQDLGGPTLSPNASDFVAKLLKAIQDLREEYGQGMLN